MNGMTAFMIAVGGASLILYWLINRAQDRSARRSPAGDGADDRASYESGGGWHAHWFGSDNFTSGNSGPSGDSGGGDSSGGGDGGSGGGDSRYAAGSDDPCLMPVAEGF